MESTRQILTAERPPFDRSVYASTITNVHCHRRRDSNRGVFGGEEELVRSGQSESPNLADRDSTAACRRRSREGDHRRNASPALIFDNPIVALHDLPTTPRHTPVQYRTSSIQSWRTIMACRDESLYRSGHRSHCRRTGRLTSRRSFEEHCPPNA